MPASTSVKYFHSFMAGAPVLNGTAGSLIAVLDACLVNGFGTKTADSVVVSGGIATMALSTGVGAFEADVVILVSGASPAGLNGEKRVISVTATSLTFDAEGISDQTATGTITAKLASAGWEKPFSGTNLAAYRSANVESTRNFLRVDDTAAQNARVVGYESMTDVDTGRGQFPTAVQMAGGLYWPKASAATANARAWTVVSDGKMLYLHTYTGTTLTSTLVGYMQAFGDFVSYKSGDPYRTIIHGTITDNSASSSAVSSCFSYYDSGGYSYSPKSYTGLGGSASLYHRAESYSATGGYSGTANSGSTPKYPNGPDNGLILSRRVAYEPSVCLRGYMLGVLFCTQDIQGVFAWRDKLVGTGPYVGRKLMVVKCSIPNNNSASGGSTLFFDITGPWA